jgi:phosphotransferase family enzyme
MAHCKLGIAREKLGNFVAAARATLRDWALAAASNVASLALEKNQPKLRYRASVSLARRGREAEALALLAPIIAKSDADLESFLPAGLNPPAADRKVLFGSGANTALARKILVGAKSKPDVYFEHRRRPLSAAKNVRNFYAFVRDEFGRLPCFVPKLHFCHLSYTDGYFLFDYLERDAKSESRFYDSSATLDRDLALRVVDRLVDVSDLRCSDIPSCADRGLLFSADPVRVEAYVRGKLRHDEDNNRFLKALPDNWSAYQQRLSEAHQIFSHGNAQKSNALITQDGDFYLVDWESYGPAPIGIDFVALFGSRIENSQFDELAERYFRSVAPRIGSGERTAILALLSMVIAVTRGLPTPRKWAHVLARL